MSKVISQEDIETEQPQAKTISADDLEPTSHGASGEWEQPQSAAERAVRTVLEPLAQFGKSGAEMAGAVAHSPLDVMRAAGRPADENSSEGEQLAQAAGGGLGLLTHRLIIQPSKENATNWWKQITGQVDSTAAERLANLVGTIPVVGPQAKSWIDKVREEGVSAIPKVAGEAAVLGVVPAAAEEVKSAVGGKYAEATKYSQNRPIVMTPEGHLQTALKPDLDPAGLKLAGEQLKAGEGKIGQPVKDIDSARAAAKAQFQQELMPQRRAIIDPQAGVTVPGSRRQLIAAKIAAIPEDIRPGSPEYNSLVEKARASVPQDLTIGELEKMNSSLNSQNRGYHQAKMSQALGKLENGSGAMDVAAEKVTRQMMQDAMEKNGLGGSEALKEINKRIGVLIKLEDSIDGVEKTARTEAVRPWTQQFKMPTLSSPGFSKGSINESIANAMRGWNSTSPPIRPNMLSSHARILDTSKEPVRNAAGELVMPRPGENEPYYPGTTVRNPNYKPGVATANFPDEGGKEPLRNAAGELVFPNTGDIKPVEAKGVEGMQYGGNTYTTYSKYSNGQFPPKPPSDINGKQIPLQPTVINPRAKPSKPIFGESQTSYADIAANINKEIPKGSKLAYKSKTLDGKQLYHYETPDGEIVAADRELDLDKGDRTKAKNFSRYQGPTPPPRRTSKK